MKIHHVFANRSNIGDWLSAKGIQKLLTPLKVTELLCDDPFIDETMLALKNAGPQDWIIIGGGGLFMDYFNPFWERFAAISDRIPFVIWGAGYCDLKTEPSRVDPTWIKKIIPQSRMCVVRDQLSYGLLAEILGSDKKLHKPVVCPSVAAIEPLSKFEKGLLHMNNYSTAGDKIYEAMQAEGTRYAEATGRMYRETNNRIEADSKKDMDHVLLRYRRSDLVISSGLHGCIIAVALGLKVLSVSGDWKIEGFMNAAGLGDWVLDLTEMDQFRKKLEALEAQPDRRNFVNESREENQKVAEKIKAMINQPAGASK